MLFTAERVPFWAAALCSSAVKSKRALHLHHDCCQMQFSEAIRSNVGGKLPCVWLRGDEGVRCLVVVQVLHMHVPHAWLWLLQSQSSFAAALPSWRAVASASGWRSHGRWGCKVIYGGEKHIDKWERKWLLKFIDNRFALLLDTDFDALFGCPRDLLHHILLGLFGEHIVNAIIHLLTHALADPLYWQRASLHTWETRR